MNSRSLNQRLKKPYGSSVYRGVYWHKSRNEWSVSISLNGKRKFICYCKTEEEGLNAINKANAKYFPDSPELQQKPYNLKDLNSLATMKW